MLNFKKFINTFAKEKMKYELSNGMLYLASPSMLITTPWSKQAPPAELVGKVNPALSGDLVALFEKSKEHTKSGYANARESGLSYPLLWKRSKRNVSILVAEPDGLLPYAVYVYEDYLRILGNHICLLGVRGKTDLIYAATSPEFGADCEYMAFIVPIRLPKPTESNLKDIAKAIIFPDR